ncbi:MAG TPA: diguanylate cyclase, partial [Spirochaetota bacterium]
MKRYLLKRALLLIPTFIGITFIIYSMARLAPGEYSKVKMSVEGNVKGGAISQDVIDSEKKLYELDKPIVIGWANWVWKSLHLDFGTSRKDGRPVITRIKETLPVSMILIIISIFIQYIISIPLGIYTAAKKD